MKKLSKFLSTAAVLITLLVVLAVTAFAAEFPVTVASGGFNGTINAGEDSAAPPSENAAYADITTAAVSVTFDSGTVTLVGGGRDTPMTTDVPVNVDLAIGKNDFTLTVVTGSGIEEDPTVTKTYYFRLFRPVLPAPVTGEGAYGFYAGGDGSAEAPYMIGSAEQLRQFAANVNGTNGYATGLVFALGDNVDLGGAWLPIGTAANPFTGVFDFAGHPVTGFTLSDEFLADSDPAAIGFFGYTSGAFIENSGANSNVLNGTITYTAEDTVQRAIGLLAGSASDTEISGVTAAGSAAVTGKAGHIALGGLCGLTDGECSVTDCSSSAALTLTTDADNAYLSSFGGLIGENAGLIDGCTMNVTANQLNASGALGMLNFGGVAGVNSGDITGSGVSLSGEMNGGRYNNGGVAGVNSGNISASSLSGSGVFSGTPQVFGGSEGSWGGVAGVNEVNGVIDACGNTNTGLVSIASPGNGVSIGGIAGENYGVLSDSDSAARITVTGASYIYVGGVAGGCDSSISGCGFSGRLNVTLGGAEPASTAALEEFNAVGGIVGFSSCAISGCTSSGSVTVRAQHEDSAVTAAVRVGGVAGIHRGSGIMNDCFNTGSVDAKAYFDTDPAKLGLYTGGLVGYNSALVRNSGNEGAVSSSIEDLSGQRSAYLTSYTGGAAGYNNGTIINCYSTGSVDAGALNPSSTAFAGGLTGGNYGRLTNVYAAGDLYAEAISNPTVATVPGFSASSSPAAVAAGGVTGVSGRGSKTAQAYYNEDMADGTIYGVGGGNSDRGTGCTAFTGDYMASEEFADRLDTNAGYLNYSEYRSGSVLRGWRLPLGNANGGYPVFGYREYPVSRHPYTAEDNETSDDDDDESSSSSRSSSSASSSSSSSSSSASRVTVSDKNANPSTGLAVSPAITLGAFAALAVPMTALAAALKKKK